MQVDLKILFPLIKTCKFANIYYKKINILLYTLIIFFGLSGDYTEAIELQYDPTTVSYLELLKMFWDHHDPTAKFKKQVWFYLILKNIPLEGNFTEIIILATSNIKIEKGHRRKPEVKN